MFCASATEDGSIRIAREECVFSEQCHCPLFGAMSRDLHISRFGGSSVEVDGLKGRFRAAIDRKSDKTPMLKVLCGPVFPSIDRKRMCAAAASESNVIAILPSDKDLELLRSNSDVVKSWSPERRKSVLLALHRRFAHSTCRKLYLTLAEHG